MKQTLPYTNNKHHQKAQLKSKIRRSIVKNQTKPAETKNIALWYQKLINRINIKLGRGISKSQSIEMIQKCLKDEDFNSELRKMQQRGKLLKFILQNRAEFCNTAKLIKFHNKFVNAIYQPSLMIAGYFTRQYQILQDIISFSKNDQKLILPLSQQNPSSFDTILTIPQTTEKEEFPFPKMREYSQQLQYSTELYQQNEMFSIKQLETRTNQKDFILSTQDLIAQEKRLFNVQMQLE